MDEHTIRMVLETIGEQPETWLYLPPQQWTLETKGIFSQDSSELAEDEIGIPHEYQDKGWIATLDQATIEDIVLNAKEQKETVSVEELFEAFLFYYEHDAFILFE